VENNCKVSVICITYNQIKYLPAAIESMLSQKTNFDYEIIIHDDVSTDGTREYIKALADKYPERIRTVLEEENQYSKGTDFFEYMIQNMARGQYIAACEGDDFWIDNNKLQIQYDAMEEHPECDMCSCWGCTVTEDGSEEVSPIRPIVHDGILPVEDVILGGGQYLVTASLFFRKSMYDNMLPFEKVIPLDYAQQIKGALRGGIYYIDRKMAVYRRYAQGSWTNDVLKSKERLRVQWDKEKHLLCALDDDTNGKYHEVIQKRLLAYTTFYEQLDSRKKDIFDMFKLLKGTIYLWGMGRRGEGFEEFCHEEGLSIDGVCDVVNEHVGEVTAYGNKVLDNKDVLKKADNILASNRYAYEDLKNSSYCGTVVDLQEFMPLG